MIQRPIYILACEANFTPKHFLTKPFRFIIKWYFIIEKLLKRLKRNYSYNHIADTYHYRKCNTLVNEAVGSGYQSINYKKWLKGRNANIYAYKLIEDVDVKQWHKDTLAMRGRKYAAKKAFMSESGEYKIFSFMNKKDDDNNDIFCSEAPVEKLQEQNHGFLNHINKDNISTVELIKLLYNNELCITKRVHVWNGKNIINNIWENVDKKID